MELIVALKSFKRFLLDLKSLIYFKMYYVKKLRKEINNFSPNFNLNDGVTVVITSFNRPDSLTRMLLSFVKYNTAQLNKIIFVEDGGCNQSVCIAKNLLANYNVIIIYHDKNIGQLSSIDEAYNLVDTEYIFHIEEDFIFTNYGFIEESVKIFSINKSLCCLSLRPHKDWRKYKLKYLGNFYKIDSTHSLIWRGTGINPGLYKTNNYRMLGNYSQYNKERIIAQAYIYCGFYGGVTKEPLGYIYHDGEKNSTRLQGSKVA